MVGKTHPQWSGSSSFYRRLYFRMPGLESAKGDNFRVKFRGNVLTLAIVWPQKYKQNIVLGPFYGELDPASMNTTRKAEQVIVSFGKRTKGRWEMIVRSGEYASLPPNGVPGAAISTPTGTHHHHGNALRSSSRDNLYPEDVTDVDKVFKQYKLAPDKTQRISRNSPAGQKYMEKSPPRDHQNWTKTDEDSGDYNRNSTGSGSAGYENSKSRRDELRGSKSPPTKVSGKATEPTGLGTADKYQSSKSLHTSKGLPLRKAPGISKVVPQSRIASNFTSRGPGTPKKIPFIDLGKVSKSPLPKNMSASKLGLNSNRQSTTRLGDIAKAPLSARSQVRKVSPRPDTATKLSPNPSMRNSRTSVRFGTAEKLSARNMTTRGSQESIKGAKTPMQMSSVSKVGNFASQKNTAHSSNKLGKLAEGSSTDYSNHKYNAGTQGSREDLSSQSELPPLSRAAAILGSVKLQQRVDAIIAKYAQATAPAVGLSKGAGKITKASGTADKRNIPEAHPVEEDLLSLQREVISSLMVRLRKEQKDRFECEKIFERTLLQDGKKISDLERVLEENVASGPISSNTNNSGQRTAQNSPPPSKLQQKPSKTGLKHLGS